MYVYIHLPTVAKTTELNSQSLRFSNQDLETLEAGQFGVVEWSLHCLILHFIDKKVGSRFQIDPVTCHFNNCVYVRKSIEKISALRTRAKYMMYLIHFNSLEPFCNNVPFK